MSLTLDSPRPGLYAKCARCKRRLWVILGVDRKGYCAQCAFGQP